MVPLLPTELVQMVLGFVARSAEEGPWLLLQVLQAQRAGRKLDNCPARWAPHLPTVLVIKMTDAAVVTAELNARKDATVVLDLNTIIAYGGEWPAIEWRVGVMGGSRGFNLAAWSAARYGRADIVEQCLRRITASREELAALRVEMAATIYDCSSQHFGIAVKLLREPIRINSQAGGAARMAVALAFSSEHSIVSRMLESAPPIAEMVFMEMALRLVATVKCAPADRPVVFRAPSGARQSCPAGGASAWRAAAEVARRWPALGVYLGEQLRLESAAWLEAWAACCEGGAECSGPQREALMQEHCDLGTRLDQSGLGAVVDTLVHRFTFCGRCGAEWGSFQWRGRVA